MRRAEGRLRPDRTPGVATITRIKNPLIGGFTLSAQDRADLIEFLKSLADDEVLHDPRFANPWPQPK